jgi:hypothetical protein
MTRVAVMIEVEGQHQVQPPIYLDFDDLKFWMK